MAAVDELDEVVREFLVESHESLDQLDRGDLVALEKDPTSKDRLASIFRTIHTIKGTCGLSFGKLESVAHVGENLLSRLRRTPRAERGHHERALLSMVDAVRRMLSDIEDHRQRRRQRLRRAGRAPQRAAGDA